MRILTLISMFLASPLLADAYDRPIPQAQSATAEFWFAGASIALIAALYAVHRLIMRK